MMKFMEEKPTNEFRWLRKPFIRADASGWTRWTEDTLQQKWSVTIGRGGAVEYLDEWRDVPVVEDSDV